MKKNIIFIASFLGILIGILMVTNFILSYCIKKCDNGHLGKVNKIFNHTTQPQIAIFGSSVGENGFNSLQLQKQTNKTVYNFCLAGTVFMQYEGLISELNEKSNSTEVVVLAECIYTFEPRNNITEIENYLPNINNNNLYQSLFHIDPDLTRKCRYVPFYKFIAVSNQYYASAVRGFKTIFKKNSDTLQGYLPINKVWKINETESLKNFKHIDVIIDSNIVKEYTNCILSLKNRGKKVVITIPPIYIPIGQKVVDLQIFRNTLNDIAHKTGSEFWDFSESMVDKKYFYNVLHLNAIGASVFNNAFADSLRKIL